MNDFQEESTNQLLDRLKRIAFNGHMPFHPEIGAYYPGERISTEVFSIDGLSLGLEQFRVGGSVGSGFAGQVYWALPEGRVFSLSDQEKIPGEKPLRVAIKVLKPKSFWKRFTRDLFFQLSFQTSFAPRVREEALRAGLIWQALLRVAAGIEFGNESTVARPLGYYWDSTLSSYAEIHEWVDGKATIYDADDRLFQKIFHRSVGSPPSLMERKQRFMRKLASLCREIGATGLARQYEWYTFVSQANVLTRREPYGSNEFTAVDCRPGLAVPFFLPLSPVHARINLVGLFHGNLAHFDEADFKKLDSYLGSHPANFASFERLVQRLKEDDGHYRAGLPGLWHAEKKGFFLNSRWKAVYSSAIDDRRKFGHVSENNAERLKGGGVSFALFLLLDRLPVLGSLFLRIIFNEKYQEHLKRIFTDRAYFVEWFEARQAADLLRWYDSGRISEERCERLSDSKCDYLYDKVLLSWLPASAHRLLIDAVLRARLTWAWFIRPFRLVVNGEERRNWLVEVLHGQVEKGILGEDQLQRALSSAWK